MPEVVVTVVVDINCCELSNEAVSATLTSMESRRRCRCWLQVVGGVSDARSGVGDGASGQSINCCELSNEAASGDVDVMEPVT